MGVAKADDIDTSDDAYSEHSFCVSRDALNISCRYGEVRPLHTINKDSQIVVVEDRKQRRKLCRGYHRIVGGDALVESGDGHIETCQIIIDLLADCPC
ncbi:MULTISPECIES: hypothetical protein [Agrobacterium]|uniref:hypothetical protein n=1 Tax=Agrobacterium TaxID=357 RepID=UPI0011C3B922|nr:MULTISPECIES: hypothetical protein [Agrobacterium]